MNVDVGDPKPRIRERRCGGWIAVSDINSPLKIGVTADTEDQVRMAFVQAVSEWREILNSGEALPQH